MSTNHFIYVQISTDIRDFIKNFCYAYLTRSRIHKIIGSGAKIHKTEFIRNPNELLEHLSSKFVTNIQPIRQESPSSVDPVLADRTGGRGMPSTSP